jgi:hypothetical protein
MGMELAGYRIPLEERVTATSARARTNNEMAGEVDPFANASVQISEAAQVCT